LTLFAPDSDKIFPVEEAGNLVVDNAVRTLREFAASDQPLQAQDVFRAAAKIKRLAEENPVINALRREPGQVMRLSTRNGTISLSLQASDGNTVGGEEVQKVELHVQAVEEKRTGKFIGLQLSRWPSID